MDIQEYILNQIEKTNLSDKEKDIALNITIFNLSQIPYFNKSLDFLFLAETMDGQIVVKNNKINHKRGFINDSLNKSYYGIFRVPKENNIDDEYYDEYEIQSKIKIKKEFISKKYYNDIKNIINIIENASDYKEYSKLISNKAQEFPEELISFFYYIETINNDHYRLPILKEFIHNDSGKIQSKFDQYYITENKALIERTLISNSGLYELSNRDITLNMLRTPEIVFEPDEVRAHEFLRLLNVERTTFLSLKENDTKKKRKDIFKKSPLSEKGKIVFSKLKTEEKINLICENYYQCEKDNFLKEIKNDFSKLTYSKPNIKKEIKEESDKIINNIKTMYPEIQLEPQKVIEQLEYVYKQCPLQNKYPKTELSTNILEENKLNFLTEDYIDLRDSNYRDLGQFAISLNKEWDKICFYIRTPKANDIVGGISCVYEKEKPNILSSPSTGIVYNYRGLGLSKIMYSKFAKELKEREQIVFSTMYTEEGASKLPRLKTIINNNSDDIIFLNAESAGANRSDITYDKFLQSNESISDINKYIKHFLINDENAFNYKKFQDSYKKMIEHFKKISKNVKKDDYMQIYDIKEETLNFFKENYTNKLKNKPKL